MTLAQIKTSPQFFVRATPIVEPLDAPEALEQKLQRFPEEVYSHARDSHLFRFLLSLCGEAGAGALKKEHLYARLQTMLESTHYGDLDRLYGNPLHLPRLSPELYTVNPHNEALTEAQWQEVKVKDGKYRARCLTWMRAIIHGASLKGIALAAEAAIDVECDIFERYVYLENSISDDAITVQDIGITGSVQEFVIIPRTHSITEEEKRQIVHLVDLLRPINTLATVHDGHEPRMGKAVMDIESSSDNWNVVRWVKGRDDIDWPDPDPQEGYWIEPDVEKEAPRFAWVDRRETATYLSITAVTGSTSHTGPFNPTQRELFSHLREVPQLFYEYKADRAYARNFAPITFSVPWVRRD